MDLVQLFAFFSNIKIFFYAIIKFMRQIILSLLSVFFLLNNIYGDYQIKNDLNFKKISIKDGLSQSTVNALFQDSRGFIWVGTNNGLNRYDGIKFDKYFYDSELEHSISSSFIISISEDSKGNMWINTTNGLNKFNIESEKFKRYNIGSSNKLTSFLFKNNNNELFISKENKIYKYNPNIDKIELYLTVYKKNVKKTDAISSIIENKYGHILIGTFRSGLYIYYKKKLLSHYTHNTKDKNSISSNSISALLEDNEKIWVGTSNAGLNLIDRQNNKIQYYVFKNNKNSIQNNTIKSIIKYENNIWVGTYRGLSIYNKDKNSWNNYRNIPNETKSISQNDIKSILIDRSKSIWIGTFGGGINKITPKKIMFEQIKSGNDPSKNINNNLVWSIFEDSIGDFWVGTEDGINRYIKKEKKYKYYNNISANIFSNKPLFPFTIVEDNRNNIWIGTNNGLLKYTKNKDKFIRFSNIRGDNNSISSNTIYNLFFDTNDQLWIGTRKGLNIYNSKNKIFIRYKQLNNVTDRVSAINEDFNKNIWFSTIGKLNKINNNGSFTSIKLQNPELKNLNFKYIRFIHFPDSATIWAGSNGGILEYSLENNKLIKHYSIQNGLPTNDVRGIAEDKFDNIWISSNNGISKYNKKSKLFKNFTINEGIENVEFNKSVYFKNKNGKIFFGGVNGITAFYSKETVPNMHKPQIFITKFKLFNKDIQIGKNSILKKSIMNSKKITLKNDENFFSFEFTALDFVAPHKNKYKYKLEGIDRDWVNTNSNNRNANYTNIPPGNYIFKVIGSNNDGIWNTKGREISIIIQYAFWQTIWFKIFLLLLIIIFSLLGFNYILRKYKKELKGENSLEYYFQQNNITEREKEVINQIMKKKSNKDIEDVLFISINTVRNHKHNIFKKLDVKNSSELIYKINSIKAL